ncbi:MAG: hypothetical protein RhofKO_22120 [Rhodothermales bacterium]
MVQGHVLMSNNLPEAHIVLPETATFIGSMRFDLYDVADTEVYLFAEAGLDSTIDRLYWIQFEAYLPTVPNAVYEPGRRGEPLVRLGEMNLFYRARFGSRNDEMPEGSEAARVVDMVSDAGYAMPGETMSAQFHQVVHPDRRSEIIVIYVESLANIDLTVEEILADGREGEAMYQLHERALPRAQERIKIDLAMATSEPFGRSQEPMF